MNCLNNYKHIKYPNQRLTEYIKYFKKYSIYSIFIIVSFYSRSCVYSVGEGKGKGDGSAGGRTQWNCERERGCDDPTRSGRDDKSPMTR